MYDYDANGFLVSLTMLEGVLLTFSNAPLGRPHDVTSSSTPGQHDHLVRHDAAGNVTSVTPSGQPAHGLSYSALDLAKGKQP